MSNNQQAVAAQTLLEQFFGKTNRFNFPLKVTNATTDGTSENAVPESLYPALERYLRGYTDRPILLPFSQLPDNRVYWFACVFSETGVHALSNELQAFIGPSYAEFDIIGTPLAGGLEQVRQALMQAGLSILTFRASTEKLNARVAERWGLYWRLLAQQPIRVRQAWRSFGQLRAEFDCALIAHNEKDARSIIVALCEQHGLGGQNRAFLEIRLNAALGRWANILNHTLFTDIIKIRLPPETYGDIWQALYETHLSQVEHTGSAQNLITRFAEFVRVTASPLLRYRGGSLRPAALKGFILHELGQETPSAQLCQSLLDKLSNDAFGTASANIRQHITALQPATGFNNARLEMELERYEQAFLLLLPLPDSLEVLQALLRCAKEIGDPVHARQTLDRVVLTDSQLADELLSTRARLIGDVEKLAVESISGHGIRKSAPVALTVTDTSVVDYWRELARSDMAEQLLSDRTFADQLVSTIEEYAVSDEGLFESLYPVWFEWLIQRAEPRASLISVYRSLIEALHVWDRYGDSELELIKMAIRHCLLAGLNAQDYGDLIGRICDIFDEVKAPGTMAWALDLADLLAVHPARDPEAHLRWVTQITGVGINYYTRLSAGERSLLHFLADESGVTLPEFDITEEGSASLAPASVTARILLYSLDSRAVERAAEVLGRLFPLAKISTNADDDCTKALSLGVRQADWVVFVSGVASHQAFYCIKNALRSNSELLYVEGTGTTRIIERVVSRSRGGGSIAA